MTVTEYTRQGELEKAIELIKDSNLRQDLILKFKEIESQWKNKDISYSGYSDALWPIINKLVAIGAKENN